MSIAVARASSEPRANPLLPALFVVLWSTGFISAKYGLPYAPPLKFLLVRFACVAALMTGVTIATRAPWPSGWRQIAHVAVASLYQGGTLKKSVSLGVASWPHPRIQGREGMLKAADDALYVAKEMGRNRVVRFDSAEFNEHIKGEEHADAAEKNSTNGTGSDSRVAAEGHP